MACQALPVSKYGELGLQEKSWRMGRLGLWRLTDGMNGELWIKRKICFTWMTRWGREWVRLLWNTLMERLRGRAFWVNHVQCMVVAIGTMPRSNIITHINSAIGTMPCSNLTFIGTMPQLTLLLHVHLHHHFILTIGTMPHILHAASVLYSSMLTVSF